ncbi:MAG: hypothetical protein SFX73_16805 [Kofleriaceae bacterium]|nr:hypothetical protein [Kofleriaceae bacterium]
MRTPFLVGVLVVAACKDKPAASPPPPSPAAAKDAQVLDAPLDAWTICKGALEKAATAPYTKRVKQILDACTPCGPWEPILGWGKLASEGGLDPRVIEQAMAACNAWCTPEAKSKFIGTLDDARAKETRTPWRLLGETCTESVSAVPDARNVSAPWFALDRVGRWAATQPGGQAVLDAVEIPVPPVTMTGVGFALAEAPVVKPASPAEHVSVNSAELTVGTLPKAKLGAKGITVVGGPYPGDPIKEKDLAARLAKATGPVALFAAGGLPAARVAVAVKAAGGVPLQLAVRATSGVPTWNAYGVVPIKLGAQVDAAGVNLTLGATPDDTLIAIKAAGAAALTKAPPTVNVSKDATVAGLASVLGALAYFDVQNATLVVSAKP